MKVRNMDGRHGPVKNQFVITGDDGTETFQSYSTAIARRSPDGHITLDADSWDYSVTTGKYRNLFLGESKAETQKKIDSGVYTLINLN